MFAARNLFMASQLSFNGSPVQFIGAAVDNAATLAIPAHLAGDIIIACAFREANATLPSSPAAGGTVPTWLDIDAAPGTAGGSMRTAYCVASATTTTTGTWTNSTLMGVAVYRGAGATPIGGHAEAGGTATTAVGPAISQVRTDGTSALLYIIGPTANSGNGTYPAPSGFTARAADFNAFNGPALVLQTKDVTTSDGAGGSAAQTSSAAYRGATIEIRAY